ncbi:MAG TPA: GNAT family N-acetyltransferase [Anaerolineaceae bacterium]|jgi:hypothetical protein
MDTPLNGSLRVTSPAPRGVWNELLARDPHSLIFQTPDWTDLMCATGQYTDASRLYESANERRFLLPLVRRKSITPRLSTQGSLPRNWGLGGLVADSPLHSDTVRCVFDDLSHQAVLQTVITPSPLLAPVWESGRPEGVLCNPRLTHILDLEGGFEEVWSGRFLSTTRTAIRKAERSNLDVEWDSTGKFLPVFFEIFMDWAVRRGRERHLPSWLVRWSNARRDPLERFELIARTLGEACRVYVARVNHEPVAATVFLIYGEHAFYYRGTSLREKANPVRANDMLQCVMIQAACQAGCRYYHMGESGGVESLMRFKTGFGAVAYSVSGYSIERLPLTNVSKGMEGILKRVENRLLSRSG